jgi:hypothetical protein
MFKLDSVIFVSTDTMQQSIESVENLYKRTEEVAIAAIKMLLFQQAFYIKKRNQKLHHSFADRQRIALELKE